MKPTFITRCGRLALQITPPHSNNLTTKILRFLFAFVILDASVFAQSNCDCGSSGLHLSGSTITLVTCSTAVMLMTPGVGLPTLGTMFPFILMLGVIMVAAPGAPGGAVMSSLGLLTSMLGFNEGQVALMIALYLAQDSFGTATNVTGDAVIAVWMDRFFGKSLAAAPTT